MCAYIYSRVSTWQAVNQNISLTCIFQKKQKCFVCAHFLMKITLTHDRYMLNRNLWRHFLWAVNRQTPRSSFLVISSPRFPGSQLWPESRNPLTPPPCRTSPLRVSPHLTVLLLLLLSCFSRVQFCATPEMAAHQAPPSLGFSRQEHWSGLPFPSPMQESEKWKWSRSVVSDSSRPRGPQPTRLLRPWDFPGKSTGVGCHCLLHTVPLPLDISYLV